MTACCLFDMNVAVTTASTPLSVCGRRLRITRSVSEGTGRRPILWRYSRLCPLPRVVGGCSGPGGSVCWHWSCSKAAGLVAGCGMCAPLSTPLAGESTEDNRQCLSLPTEVGAHRLRSCRASGRAVMWTRPAVTTEACSLRWSLVSPCWKSDCPMLIVRTRFCATRWSSSMLG